MRVANTTSADNLVRSIQKLSSQQSRLQNQVSTGQRISRISDDPSAAGRVMNLQSEQRSLAQFNRNADRAMEVSQATFSGLQQLKKISDRAGEIATLAGGTMSDEARRAYAAEIDQLIEQGVQLGNSRLGEDYLFAGTATGTTPMAVTRAPSGQVSGVTYAGDTGRTTLPLSETGELAPGASPATNSGTADFLNHLVSLRDALKNGDSAAAQTSRTNLLASENVFVDALAEQGAVQLRIEANQQMITERTNAIEQLVSSEVDSDLPSTIVRLNQSQIAYQAALQSAASIMKTSLLDYLR